MTHESGDEGSDSAVYPELARANLLRMRGDYKAAEGQCLTILRRFPNNTTANILLGDICTEKGDLEQAMQWYEMALDLSPESQAAQHKLEQVRQRFKDKETVQTVEQLGLPTTKSKAGLYAVCLIIAIFVIAVVAYLLGHDTNPRVEATGGRVIATTGGGGQIDNTTGGGIAPLPPGSQTQPRDDDSLLKAIQSTGTEGARVLSAFEDPRSRALTISYSVLEGEDARSLGATIASQAFDQVPESTLVTLRGIQKGETVFMADCLKTLYEETLTQTWKSDHAQNPNAWVDHILSNEWPSQQTAETATPPIQTGGGAGDVPPGDTDQDTTATVTKPAADKSATDKAATDKAASDKSEPTNGTAEKKTDEKPSEPSNESSKTEDQGSPSGTPSAADDQTSGGG